MEFFTDPVELIIIIIIVIIVVKVFGYKDLNKHFIHFAIFYSIAFLGITQKLLEIINLLSLFIIICEFVL